MNDQRAPAPQLGGEILDPRRQLLRTLAGATARMVVPHVHDDHCGAVPRSAACDFKKGSVDQFDIGATIDPSAVVDAGALGAAEALKVIVIADHLLGLVFDQSGPAVDMMVFVIARPKIVGQADHLLTIREIGAGHAVRHLVVGSTVLPPCAHAHFSHIPCPQLALQNLV